MTSATANAVYNVLVTVCGADIEQRQEFVRTHTLDPTPNEWRFIGSLSFGGKFRSKTFTVDCYPEDETDERRATIKEANWQLKEIRVMGDNL